jgi:hypothetical protein
MRLCTLTAAGAIASVSLSHLSAPVARAAS